MKKFLKEHINIIFFIGLFIFFIGFHCVIHPLYIYDTDDWTYISEPREPLPQIGAWNPSRVFPEILIPFLSKIGVYFITPILQSTTYGTPDYINGMALSFGIAYSLVWVIYFGLIYKLINLLLTEKGKIGSIICTLACICAHFSFFNNHKYLFSSSSVTLVFYYTVPLLLNTILILLSECDILSSQKKEETYSLKFSSWYSLGFIIVLGYVCIFSNIIQSIISATYFGTLILLRFFSISQLKRTEIVTFFKDTYLYLGYVLTWLFSALIELGGGRADSLKQSDYNFVEETIGAIKYSVDQIRMLSKLAIIFIFIVFIFLIMKRHNLRYKYYFTNILKMVIAFGIISLFYVVMATRTGASYMTIGFLSGSMVPVVISAIFVYALILNKFNFIAAVMPLVIFISAFSSIFGRQYNEYNFIEPNAIYNFDNYVIASVIESEQNGEFNIELLVPVHLSEDNFPIATTYGGERISNSLYRLGITQKRVNINLIPSESINEKYNIEIK